ncbi:DUF7144 family membrane protein [Actinoplanes sp. CA-051413]|uniref:DUF7144 family membrane protein n=1 Tax=Actinoplanes sp. CA-051413 TaxID=3239899 RepID=UPI003D96D017
MATRRGGAWAGWIVFAGVMMTVTSSINIFEGCLALIADERVVATADEFILVDLTSWGWTLVLFGVVMLGSGLGLFAGAVWARIASVVVIGLHAVAQVLWLGAYPVWSLLMITLDTVVLFALCARWAESRPALRSRDIESRSADGIRGEELYGQLPPQVR